MKGPRRGILVPMRIRGGRREEGQRTRTRHASKTTVNTSKTRKMRKTSFADHQVKLTRYIKKNIEKLSHSWEPLTLYRNKQATLLA